MDPVSFAAVWDRQETRVFRDVDRDFRVGDTLYLREYDREAGRYTGRSVRATVHHVSVGGTHGMPPEKCVMSIFVYEWNSTTF